MSYSEEFVIGMRPPFHDLHAFKSRVCYDQTVLISKLLGHRFSDKLHCGITVWIPMCIPTHMKNFSILLFYSLSLRSLASGKELGKNSERPFPAVHNSKVFSPIADGLIRITLSKLTGLRLFDIPGLVKDLYSTHHFIFDYWRMYIGIWIVLELYSIFFYCVMKEWIRFTFSMLPHSLSIQLVGEVGGRPFHLLRGMISRSSACW